MKKRILAVCCFMLCAIFLTGCVEYEFSYEIKENGAGTMALQVLVPINEENEVQQRSDIEEAGKIAQKYDVQFKNLNETRDGNEKWIGYNLSGAIAEMRLMAAGEGSEGGVLGNSLGVLDEFYGDVDAKGNKLLVIDLRDEAEAEVVSTDIRITINIKVAGKLQETNGETQKNGTIKWETSALDESEGFYAIWQVTEKFAKNNPDLMQPKPEPSVDISSEVGKFRDVVSSDWFAIPVWTMSKYDVISGFEDATFRPEQPITRADFLVMVMRAYDVSLEVGAGTFNDVPAGYYFSASIAAAKKAGIVSGDDYGNFRPYDSISRQDMCVMLYNILEQQSALPQGDNGRRISNYADGWKVRDYATEKLECFLKTGVVNGLDGVLSPDGALTRAQAAQVLSNLR